MKMTIHLDIDAIKARVLARQARETALRARGVVIFRDWVTKLKGKRTMKVGCLIVAAVLFSACGYKNPTAPTVDPPRAGVASKIELTVLSGQGAAAGHADISARVFDAYFNVMPNLTVTFAASGGAFAADAVVTDFKGIAHTTITAPPGGVVVMASTAGVSAQTLAAIQPPK